MDKQLIYQALTQAEAARVAIDKIEIQLREAYKDGDAVHKDTFFDNFAAAEYRFSMLRIRLNRMVDNINVEKDKLAAKG